MRAIPLQGSTDRILSLPDLLALVGGYVPLVLEVKSTWRGDGMFEANIAEQLASYAGPVAVMSFDPHSVAAFRRGGPALPRGLVADRFDDADHWRTSPPGSASPCGISSQPPSHGPTSSHTISGAAGARAADRKDRVRAAAADLDGRTEADRERALRYADAMIFEGIEP